MKSKLFSRFDPNTEENKKFSDDLKIVLSVRKEKRDKIISLIIEYVKTFSWRKAEEIVEKLSTDLNLEVVKINKVVQILTFFMDKINNDSFSSDTPEKWTDDLKDISIINEEESKEMLEVFNSIWDLAKNEYKKVDTERTYKKGVLPSVKSVGYTVELRGIFKDEFKYGGNVNEFTPELIDFIPIISIGITTESDKQKNRFVFQAEKEHLKRIICVLESAIKEAELIQVKNRG